MTSLSEVYVRDREGRSIRQLAAGVSLFAIGIAMISAAIVLTTTAVGSDLGFTLIELRRLAGTIGGFGVPAVLLGAFLVFPASRRIQAAAVIGVGVSILGVGLFRFSYPQHWLNDGMNLTLPVLAIYSFGSLVTAWCLFVGVSNVRRRKAPGGTVSLEVTSEGTAKIVDISQRLADRFNESPRVSASVGRDEAAMTAMSDGGDGAVVIQQSEESTTDSTESPPSPHSIDRYCGNCQYFEYVQTVDGIQPSCTYHDELMDDMDPCEYWQGRNGE